MRGTTRRRVSALAVLGAVLGVLLGAQLLPGAPVETAKAHAVVVSTTPENGDELEEAPTEIRVTFDEAVTFSGLEDPTAVIDADGKRVDSGTGTLDGTGAVLTIPIRADIPVGVYIASWRVVSADTHPVGGSIQFGYGTPASAASAPETPEPRPELTLAVGLVKAIVYLGLILAFGTVPITVLLSADGEERRRISRMARIGLGIAVIASIVQEVVQFLWIRSAESTASGDPFAAFALFAATPYGIAVAARVVVLFAAFWSARSGGRARLVVHVALGLAAIVTVVVNGHGGAGSPLLFLSTTAHAVGAIGWTGGLLALGGVLLRTRLSAARLQLLPHWSRYAACCVGILLLSGLLQSVDAVRFPEALFATDYGAILSAKLILVAFAALLGGWGFLWIRRRRHDAIEGRPAPGRTAQLRRGVRIEAATTAVIVAVSGVLSSVSPAKDDWSPVATESATIGPYLVDVEIAPTRLGPESLRITVVAAEKETAQPERLDVVLSEESGPVQGLQASFPYRIPQPLDPGKPTATTFVSASVNVPSSGRWEAVVTVVVDRLTQYSGTVSYEVR